MPGWPGRLVDIARPQPGERVLDIATGTGLVAIPTARLVGESGRVVGVDISKGMLDRASKAVEAEGLGNIELVHMDAEKLAFPASSFDLILCSSALPYLSDIPAALRLWHGLLKPGGRLAFNCRSDTSYNMGPLLRLEGGVTDARKLVGSCVERHSPRLRLRRVSIPRKLSVLGPFGLSLFLFDFFHVFLDLLHVLFEFHEE